MTGRSDLTTERDQSSSSSEVKKRPSHEVSIGCVPVNTDQVKKLTTIQSFDTEYAQYLANSVIDEFYKEKDQFNREQAKKKF